MDDRELLNEMMLQNPWWKSGKIVLEEGLVERDIFSNLKADMARKEVVALIGLRRVGKTTLEKQLISFLMEKTGHERILYFSFDAMKKEERIIKRVLDLYFKQMLREVPSELRKKVYVFFDEVQKVMDWGEEIKSFYDKNLEIKFFVSGSSSMNILKGSGESLVGRIVTHKVRPFSFREFLRYNNMDIRPDKLEKVHYPHDAEKLELLFDKYVEYGGFPELYKFDEAGIRSALKTITDLTLFRDIVNMFDIKRVDVLEGLFRLFVKTSGNIVNYSKISNSLNTKFETVKMYIDYFSSSFMVSKSFFYSKSRIKSMEKNVKIYISDHAFACLEDLEHGLKLETIIFNHCSRMRQKREGVDEIFYWQDEKKNEVDIIMKTGKKLLPIEVKAGGNEPKGMLSFCKKFGIKKGYVITKSKMKTQKVSGIQVIYLPAWLFLLTE